MCQGLPRDALGLSSTVAASRLEEYPSPSYPLVPTVLSSSHTTPTSLLFHMSSAYTTIFGNSLFSDSG